MSQDTQLITLTADIVAAHVAHNAVPVSELAPLISAVHTALAALGAPLPEEPAKPEAAVSARKSLAHPGHILSMIDGKPYKMLRRHIGLHGYTPQSYRAAFGLAADYPMVAPEYAAHRSAMAHRIGLGRKPKSATATAESAAPATPNGVPGDTLAPAAVPARTPRRTLKPAFAEAIAAAKDHLGAE